jgi:hypothetical protein
MTKTCAASRENAGGQFSHNPHRHVVFSASSMQACGQPALIQFETHQPGRQFPRRGKKFVAIQMNVNDPAACPGRTGILLCA